MITRLLLAFITAAAIPSCVAPPPPPAPMPAPYCPPKKVAYCPPAKKAEPEQTGGRLVDGRFIRDTPPDQVEPAKTIRVEKDF